MWFVGSAKKIRAKNYLFPVIDFLGRGKCKHIIIVEIESAQGQVVVKNVLALKSGLVVRE